MQYFISHNTEKVQSPRPNRQPAKIPTVRRNVFITSQVQNEFHAAIDKTLKLNVLLGGQVLVEQAAVVQQWKDEGGNEHSSKPHR